MVEYPNRRHYVVSVGRFGRRPSCFSVWMYRVEALGFMKSYTVFERASKSILNVTSESCSRQCSLRVLSDVVGCLSMLIVVFSVTVRRSQDRNNKMSTATQRKLQMSSTKAGNMMWSRYFADKHTSKPTTCTAAYQLSRYPQDSI